MPTTVLVLVETINEYLQIIESSDFHVILAPTPAERAQAIKTHGGQIQAVLTRGPLGLYAEEIAALPLLEIICVIGAGYEVRQIVMGDCATSKVKRDQFVNLLNSCSEIG